MKHLIDTLRYMVHTLLEPSKSAVIHFIRGKKTRPEDEVKTALGTTKATSKQWLLGVEIDYKLSFHGHLQNVASKLNRLSGVLRGTNRSTRLLSIKMAFIPTLTFCSLPWFPYVSKSRLKPSCKIYRRLVLWATGAASTTKHENLLAESAMLSIDDTLTIYIESTWTKWKCFHDRHPISDLTTAATIAISKKKFSIRMASLAEVLTRRQTRSPDLYSPQTPLIDPAESLHGSKVWAILKSSYIRPRTVQTMRGLNQNLHCHTIISYTQTVQRWKKKLGLFSKRRSSSLPSANHPTFIWYKYLPIRINCATGSIRLCSKTSRLNNNFHRQQIKFRSIGKCLLDQSRNCTALHYLRGKFKNYYSKDIWSFRNPRQRYCRPGS